MDIGVNLLLWTDQPSEASFPLLDEIKAIGFDSVELPIYGQDLKEMTAIGKKLDELGFTRTAATTCSAQENPASPDVAIRSQGVSALKRVLDRCTVAGCDILVGPLHSALGAFSGKFPTEDEYRYSADSLYEVAEYAETLGIRLALEPINRFESYLVNTVAQGIKLVNLVGHRNCALMYDTFHAHIEEKDVKKAIRDVKDYLIHVHISECDRSTPGSGQVRWQETFETLKEIGFDGPLVIEAFGSSLPNLVAATKIWRRMFNSERQLAQDGLAFIRKNIES